MSRATDTAFDVLHALAVSIQTEELERNIERARLPKRIPDPENPGQMMANPDYEPLNTRLLQTAIKMLKDNGIDVPATSARFNGLVEKLQNLDLDEAAAERLQ